MKNGLLLALFLIIGIAIGFLLEKTLVKGKPIKGYLDLIPLSQEQKHKVEEIRKDFLPQVENIRHELRDKRLQLNDLIFAPNHNIKAVENKMKEISDLQIRLEKEVIDHILQEKEILTLEQRRQFSQIIRKEFEKGGLGVHGERK